MPMKVAQIDTREQPYNRRATPVGPGLVLLEIETSATYDSGNVVHWLLADGNKPPFDIAVHAEIGRFLRLVFFVSHETIPQATAAPVALPSVQGGVLFDLSPWPDGASGKRYVEEKGIAPLLILDGGLHVQLADRSAYLMVDSGVVRFSLDVSNDLVGIYLPQIGEDILGYLRSAGVLDEA